MNAKTKITRSARFAPRGIPRYVRCYDNGGTDTPGGSIDRYTVLFTGLRTRIYPYLAMNAYPFHPQGFGQHGESKECHCDIIYTRPGGGIRYGRPPAIGRKHPALGRRINFADLPKDCKRAVWQDYADYWNIPVPAEI